VLTVTSKYYVLSTMPWKQIILVSDNVQQLDNKGEDKLCPNKHVYNLV